MDSIRIAIADDHDLFRQGMKAMLESHKRFKVVVEAENGLELLSSLGNEPCDVLILDLDMPKMDGFGVLEALEKNNIDISVLIVSMHDSGAFVSKALRSGANGFLPKNCDFNLACEAVRAVKNGGYFFDKATSQALAGFSSDEYPDGLNEREAEIIRLICQGKKTHEIADHFFVSNRTVDGYRHSIYKKTNTDNIPELVLYAVRSGIYRL
jgi:DNA-binding NarL/FixJ family response regulator